MGCQILEASTDRNLGSNLMKIGFERNQQVCEQWESNKEWS